jgi:succinoglycan biosynthesis transport protein ExoP
LGDGKLESGLDIRFIIGVLRRRMWIMITSFAVIAAVAVTVAVLLPPVYRAQAQLLVESQQIPPDLVRSTVTSMAEERLQVIKQRITTRDALLSTVERFNLYPEERANLTPSELVERMRERIVMENVDFSTRSRGRRETLVIGFTVAFEDRSPGTTVTVVNDLITKILQEDVRSRTERASETTEFLQRETDRRREELSQLEARISKFKLENDASLPEKQQYLMSRLDAARAQLIGLDRDLQANEEQQRLMELELSVRKAGGELVTANSPSGMPAPSRELQALKAELARKQTVYTDSHPDIQALKQQINALEGATPAATDDAASEAADAAAESNDTPATGRQAVINLAIRLLNEKIDSTKERHRLIKSQREEVAKSVEEISQLLLRVPEVQVTMSNLERQREILRTGLEDLTSKLNQARLGEQLERDRQAERFQVIEQPVTPDDPVKPNRPLILAGGLAGAIFAALGVAVLLELLNRSVRTANDITRAIQQPPLGTIPYFETNQERSRRRRRVLLALLLMALLGACALAAIHLLYLPLDEVYFKVLRRFGLH